MGALCLGYPHHHTQPKLTTVTTLLSSSRRLRPLAPELAAIPPLAYDSMLAYIRVQPPNTELGHDAGAYLNELMWGVSDLKATTRFTDRDGRANVSVTSDSAGDDVTVNELLIRAGLARVSKTQVRSAPAADSELVRALMAAQQDAKSRHVGMYRFGDVGDSDDEGM